MEVHIRGEVFDGALEKIKYGEAAKIESITGKSYGQFEPDLREGGALAWIAYVYTLLHRTHPDIRVSDVEEMAQDEVTFVLPSAGAPDVPSEVAVEAGEPVDPTPKVSEQPDETPS